MTTDSPRESAEGSCQCSKCGSDCMCETCTCVGCECPTCNHQASSAH
jgi:hypothetical protein